MKKSIHFLKEQRGDVTRITASYNGISVVYQHVGNRAQRCYLGGRGNVRQIKHLLREFIKSAKVVDG